MVIVLVLLALQIVDVSLAVNCTFDSQQQAVWREQEFPDPRIDLSKCGLCYNSMVCDPNNLLSTFEAEQLNDLLMDIATYTTCPSSPSENTIFLAIINEIDKYGRSMSRDELQERVNHFTEYLLKTKWNLGDCGGIIFIASMDRKVFTITGSKLKNQLTDSCVQGVYENIKTYLSDNDYYSGLRSMIRQYRDILENNERCSIESSETSKGWIAGVVVGIIVVLVVCVVIFLRVTGRACQGGCHDGGSGHHTSHGHRGWIADSGGGHDCSGGGGGGGGGGGDSSGGGGGDF